MKLKSVMRFYLTWLVWLYQNTAENNKGDSRIWRSSSLLHCWGNVKWYSHHGMQARSLLKNEKQQSHIIQQCHFWVYIAKNWEQGLRHLIFILSLFMISTMQTQASTDRGIGKQDVTAHRILLSLKNKESSETSYNCMNLEKPSAKWNQPVTKDKYGMWVMQSTTVYELYETFTLYIRYPWYMHL